MPKKNTAFDQPSILAAAIIVAVGGLIYELLLGTASSYLFGDSVKSFSISIGTTLFGMGLGSLAAVKFIKAPAVNFVKNELVLSLIGGNSVLLLFAAFAFTQLYWLVFIVLSLSIGFAIGLEIPLMVSMARKYSTSDNVNLLSKVLALDYIGALVASLLFPFILLPYLGLVRTAYLVALLNVAIAAFILYRLRMQQLASPGLRTATLATVAILAGCFLYSQRIESAINTSIYSDPVVHYQFSPYQKIAITNYGDDTRLFLSDQLQFSSIDEARYHETLAHAAMTSTKSQTNILILGGGDGLLAREVLKYPGVKHVTIVDIDKAVTDLAKNQRLIRQINRDSLHDKRVTIVNDDAFTFVRSTNQTFNVILSDLIDPSNEKVSKLYSKEFYHLTKNRLAANGTFITQATSSYFTPSAFAIINKTIASAYEPQFQVTRLSVNVPSFGEWGFVMATANGNRQFEEHGLPEGLAYVDPKKLSVAQVEAGNGQDASKLAISTLLSPTIYPAYQADMSQWRY